MNKESILSESVLRDDGSYLRQGSLAAKTGEVTDA